MKIFLSGKVDELFGSWRDDLLGIDHEWDKSIHETRTIPKWVIRSSYDCLDTKRIQDWPCIPHVILGTHDYTGPYRQVITGYDESENCGYFHGVATIGSHGYMDTGDREVVVERCKKAIDDSDMVFCYLNTPDCFGSMVEIGYAAAQNKFIAIAVDDGDGGLSEQGDDVWFALTLVQHTDYFRAGNEKDFLRNSLLNAISKRSAWQPHKDTRLGEVAYSMSMIYRWSSDPRVRTEAKRMLDKLQK